MNEAAGNAPAAGAGAAGARSGGGAPAGVSGAGGAAGAGSTNPPSGGAVQQSVRSISPRSKGKLGEAAGVAALTRAGYELLPTKINGNQGFDHVGVLRNPDGSIKEICIVESKYSQSGNFRLAQSSKGKQMGKDWIAATLRQMTGSDDPSLQETARLIQQNEDKVVVRGHVLDGDMVNRWKKATEVVRAL
jgi:hypothetical protein